MDYDRFFEQIVRDGFGVFPEFLSSSEIEPCVLDFEAARSEGRFSRAGIGRGSERSIRDEIRRDSILWLNEPGETAAQRLLFERCASLRDRLNRELFLGLWSLEAHYAFYPAGGFYKRHVDVFRDDDSRTVSVVLYLNTSWKPGDGGELRIYPRQPGQSPSVIEPRAGTLVCFLSRDTEHEVLESRIDRRSFTGWMKRRS